MKLLIGKCLKKARLLEATTSFDIPLFCFSVKLKANECGCQANALGEKKKTNTIYLFMCMNNCVFPLSLSLSCLPCFRTSEDERGNRHREVLGQSLGAAGWMHWAVVSGAASVGKGRPGPISVRVETSSDKTSPSERQTGKKETCTENQHHTTLQLSERGDTKEKRSVYSFSGLSDKLMHRSDLSLSHENTRQGCKYCGNSGKNAKTTRSEH